MKIIDNTNRTFALDHENYLITNKSKRQELIRQKLYSNWLQHM